MIEKNDPNLKVGAQVMYVPRHVREECKGDLELIKKHPNAEFGFISSWCYDTVFVRFWSKVYKNLLRTLSCSEGCSFADLDFFDSKPAHVVDATVEYLRINAEEYAWREQQKGDE